MDKNKKICIVIIAILVLLILLVIGMKYYNFKNSSTEVLGYNNSLSNEIQNSNTIQIDNTLDENNTIVSNIVQTASSNNEEETKIENANNDTKNKNAQEIKKPSNSKSEKTKTENKAPVKTDKTNNNSEQKKQDDGSNADKQQGNPKLANTRYTETNTEVIPEIMNILDDEIAKDEELTRYGSKAVKGNKQDAYKNTNGFTYRFVKDIEKGKVKGNYAIFEQRVRNNVGAYGKYFVYAEDEYVYDAKGIAPHWSQTLVWIYVTF